MNFSKEGKMAGVMKDSSRHAISLLKYAYNQGKSSKKLAHGTALRTIFKTIEGNVRFSMKFHHSSF